MRCYNCKKKFDYEKYYGICPKCGCFNKKETEEELHQAYHTAYDDGYTHERYEYENLAQNTPYVEVAEQKGHKRGSRLFLSGLIFMLLAVVLSVLVPMAVGAILEKQAQKQVETGSLTPLEYDMRESIRLGEIELSVTECRILADAQELKGLEEGMKLLAVQVKGVCNGEAYEDAKMERPYLEAGGSFRRALSTYDFEPYTHLYGISLFNTYDLYWEGFGEGWYVFLTEEENTEAVICFEERDYTKKAEPLKAIHGVKLTWEEEGGEQDEE